MPLHDSTARQGELDLRGIGTEDFREKTSAQRQRLRIRGEGLAWKIGPDGKLPHRCGWRDWPWRIRCMPERRMARPSRRQRKAGLQVFKLTLRGTGILRQGVQARPSRDAHQ